VNIFRVRGYILVYVVIMVVRVYIGVREYIGFTWLY